jgi:hypothetical protein
MWGTVQPPHTRACSAIDLLVSNWSPCADTTCTRTVFYMGLSAEYQGGIMDPTTTAGFQHASSVGLYILARRMHLHCSFMRRLG